MSVSARGATGLAKLLALPTSEISMTSFFRMASAKVSKEAAGMTKAPGPPITLSR